MSGSLAATLRNCTLIRPYSSTCSSATDKLGQNLLSRCLHNEHPTATDCYPMILNVIETDKKKNYHDFCVGAHSSAVGVQAWWSENKPADVQDGEEDEGEDEVDEMEIIGASSGSIVPMQLPPSCSAAPNMMTVREQQNSYIMSTLNLLQDQSTHHQHQLFDHQQKLFDLQRQYAELFLVVQRLQRQAHGEQPDLETQPIQRQQRRVAHIEQRQEEHHQKHQWNSLEQLRLRAQATTITADSRSFRGNVPHPEPSSPGSYRLPNYESMLACGVL
ncbi:MAG: hypothetical protein JOS17DRAFT_776996 [Linnemannia elongata]|nr:MAG: hypothetical protein JOS17DRAFT_776996 [Linnemannia elongata]